MAARHIRVAVVDDSSFIRKAIARMLGDDARIEVVGTAGSGEELLTHFERWKPDVVTLDLDMPGMGGLATLDRIRAMGSVTPVIILSTHSGKGAPMTIEALHRGATDFIDKQRYSLVDFESLRSVLLRKIFQVTHVDPDADETSTQDAAGALAELPAEVAESDAASAKIPGAYDVILLGASTGGPPTIEKILNTLGSSVPAPIVIVQHMPIGFTQAFADRLNAYLPLQVCEAVPGEQLRPDTVYIAPAGCHLRLRRQDADLFVELDPNPGGLQHVPSIDVLFESAARAVGSRVIGVLLTGMGRDGAQGMAALKKRGAYTIIQDEASCIVFGMPRAALALRAVTEVAMPTEIGYRLQALVHGKHPKDP